MWGLVGLARRHPAARVEQACEQAVGEARVTLKAITGLLARLSAAAEAGAPASATLAEAAPEQRALPLAQHDELIRDAGDYADFFAAATAAAAMPAMSLPARESQR